MLRDIVLDYVSKNYEKILNKIATLSGDSVIEEDQIRNIDWEYIPAPSREIKNVAGVDGSVNYIEYRGTMFTVANAEVVALKDQGIVRLEAAGFADLISPYWLPRERSKLYMEILEYRTALSSLLANKDIILLFDGSLLNSIPHLPRRYFIPFSDDIKAVEEMFSERFLDSRLKPDVYSREIILEQLESQHAHNKILTIEVLELLCVLKNLLNIELAGRVFWIAKNSTDNTLFKKPVSDVAILDRVTAGRGFIPVGSARLHGLEFFEVFEYLKRIPIFVYYARLEDDGPVLRIEAPYVPKNEIGEVLSLLSSISPAGYPYVLRVAHRDVVIRNSDVKVLAGMLGLNILGKVRGYL